MLLGSGRGTRNLIKGGTHWHRTPQLLIIGVRSNAAGGVVAIEPERSDLDPIRSDLLQCRVVGGVWVVLQPPSDDM